MNSKPTSFFGNQKNLFGGSGADSSGQKITSIFGNKGSSDSGLFNTKLLSSPFENSNSKNTGIQGLASLFGKTIEQNGPIGSQVASISPGTQKDRYFKSSNKENFEVLAYNFPERFNNHSIKMLRLQDYMNFKNSFVGEEHKKNVIKYFEVLKNQMFPNLIAQTSQGTNQSSLFQTAGNSGGNIFGGSNSGSSLASIFGKPQNQTQTGASPNIFGSVGNTASGGINMFSTGNSQSMNGIMGQNSSLGLQRCSRRSLIWKQPQWYRNWHVRK